MRMIVPRELDGHILRRCTGLLALKNSAAAEQGAFDAMTERKGCFCSLCTASRGKQTDFFKIPLRRVLLVT